MKHGDGRRPKRGDLGAVIKRAVAKRFAQNLREDPDRFNRLVEMGVIDAQTLAELPEHLDFATVVTRLRDHIADLAHTQPSVLTRLDVRSLDVMCCDEDEIEASQQMVHTPLTVLFSDLEGFTSFTSHRGDLEASALLTDHYDTVDAIVRSRGGHVVKTLGDGHLLSFAEAAAAVMAAVDLIDAAPRPLRLRAGAHRGLVVRRESDLLGHVVNVAARVTDLAAGGMALVTTDVRDAAGRLPAIVFEPARAETVVGIEDPIEVCAVHAA